MSFKLPIPIFFKTCFQYQNLYAHSFHGILPVLIKQKRIHSKFYKLGIHNITYTPINTFKNKKKNVCQYWTYC